jgi:hypothetical protein
MSLDPKASRSWNSLFDSMRPPTGYTLVSAVGTTYGLSLDTVVASLIAMDGADAVQLSTNPVAGLLSATRLASRVRIFFQNGRCQRPSYNFPTSLATLIEPVVVRVQMQSGEYHPKLWVFRFENGDTSDTLIRTVIGSRNLAESRALEAGIILEGRPSSRGDSIGIELARAVRSCLSITKSRCRPITDLAEVLDRTAFDIPHEGDDLTRLFWQDSRHRTLVTMLPPAADRAIVVSPFLSPAFINGVLPRFRELTVVTSNDTLNQLDDLTFSSLEKACDEHLYVVDELSEDVEGQDGGYLDGIHAKIIVLDKGNGTSESTFIGSANATGQGWGLGGPSNVEVVVQLQPGLGYARFLESFVRESTTRLKPWIKQFKREDRAEIDDDIRLRDRLRDCLADLSSVSFVLKYDPHNKTLQLTCESNISAVLDRFPLGSSIQCLPFGFGTDRQDWKPVQMLIDEVLQFGDTELSSVSSFIILRASHTSVTVTSLAIGKLDLDKALNAERAQAVRNVLLAAIPRDELLAALILGDYRASASFQSNVGSRDGRQSRDTAILGKVTLEQLLQALASNPELLHEMQVLFGNSADEAFVGFCNALDAAFKTIKVL